MTGVRTLAQIGKGAGRVKLAPVPAESVLLPTIATVADAVAVRGGDYVKRVEV